ncbi:MAG: hydroxymethylbilane synthase [Dehalococcoidia bacterium]
MAVEAPRRTLVIGTRGSELARLQTEETLALLRRAQPELLAEVRVIRTSGDRDRVSSLSVIGGKGVFVKELEYALLDRTIDLAVHSLKDLPPRLEPGLTLAGVSPRVDPRDALVSRDGAVLAALPSGSRIGTSSARRRAQILYHRPDLPVVEVRGNVDTRIRKVATGEVDGVVLAAAGLNRLGRLSEASELFSVDDMLPAPGQGTLGWEVRKDDRFAMALVQAAGDEKGYTEAMAERAFQAGLGAGCTLPVGGFAVLDGVRLRLSGLIGAADGRRMLRETRESSSDDAVGLGGRLAEILLAAGGRELLDGPA